MAGLPDELSRSWRHIVIYYLNKRLRVYLFTYKSWSWSFSPMDCVTKSISSAAFVWMIAKIHRQVQNTGFIEGKINFIEFKINFLYKK